MSKTVIFAHYDKNNKIDDYVVYYLDELKKIATNIIFVSDCDIEKDELQKINHITNHIIAKRHGKYDFGSYKIGYLFAKENHLLNTNELILANDSCFGPLKPLSEIWDEINKKECDFWGINSNDIDVEYHLQSFFLVFKESVFKSNIFDKFMTGIKKQENKDSVIKEYEIGLTKLLQENGFRAEALINQPIDRKITQNLIFKSRNPLIKKLEILNLYPKLTKIFCKKIIKRQNSNYNVNLITNYSKKYSKKSFKNNVKILRRLLIDIKLKKGEFNILGKNIFNRKKNNKSTNKPLVSVLIPAYNHENYIQETIDSIISQTYKNIELIIIDDGSKDSTWKKIQETEKDCKKRFNKILFKTKENEGSCKTINQLLSLANGDYVYIIASDDIAKPQAIEKELNFLIQNKDYALAVGDNTIIDSSSKECYWDKKRNIVYDIKKAKYKTFGEYLQKIHKFNFSTEKFGSYEKLYANNHIPNGFLIKKSIFEKTGYFTPQAPLEDWYLMLQISKYAKIKYINEPLFSYRWHENNTIKQSEKMKSMTNKTREYEINILKNIDFNKTLPNIQKVFLNGVITKKIGIPYIIEVQTILKEKRKFKRFKLFNIKIKDFKAREI